MRFSKAQKWRSKYFPRKKAKKPRGDTTTWYNGVVIIFKLAFSFWLSCIFKRYYVTFFISYLNYQPSMIIFIFFWILNGKESKEAGHICFELMIWREKNRDGNNWENVSLLIKNIVKTPVHKNMNAPSEVILPYFSPTWPRWMEVAFLLHHPM